jgi:hypothetical protein
MICEPCKAGGKFVGLPEHSAELHHECKGGTWCDCQHLTETVLKGGTS